MDGARPIYQHELARAAIGNLPFIESARLGEGIASDIRMDIISAYEAGDLSWRRVEAVYVLHAFQKKTPATPRLELELARRRYAQLKPSGK